MHLQTISALFPLEADTNSLSDDDIDIDDDTMSISTHDSNPHDNPQNTDPPTDDIHIPDQLPPRHRMLANLKSWIIPSNTPRTHPPPNHLENPIRPKAPRDQHYQQPLVSDTNNNHWGDLVPTPKPINTF